MEKVTLKLKPQHCRGSNPGPYGWETQLCQTCCLPCTYQAISILTFQSSDGSLINTSIVFSNSLWLSLNARRVWTIVFCRWPFFSNGRVRFTIWRVSRNGMSSGTLRNCTWMKGAVNTKKILLEGIWWCFERERANLKQKFVCEMLPHPPLGIRN